ncbi:F-box domain protein [Oesophagostomum dentatum]|uniref:F-box domain protein n=1 Tax=Oesophagostomum dentatum TaxID=61180 RepID=A0A0B1SD45_OESDE|nr:F-box domain protein [Oesophagostomum dentatum]
MNRTRVLWRNAKKKFSECQHKLKSLVKRTPKPTVKPPVVLNDVVMEEILKRLDLSERVRMRVLSKRVHAIVDRMPLILPFIFIRSDARGNIELHCDHVDVLLDYILVDMQGFKVVNGAIAFNYTNARSVLTAIISRITGVTHLWLDSAWNGHIIQVIVEYYQAINHGSKRQRYVEFY